MARWRWLPAVVFALLAFLVAARPLFSGQTIGDFDQIRQMAPWNGPKPKQPWDILQVDSVLQFYPWRDLVFEAWSKGQLPLWNPYQLCGTPLLANSQSAGFYPPHVLMGLLHVPTGAAILLLGWFHLFWAALGAYSLARRIGATRTGGCVAGVSFGGSTFMLAWLALPSVVSSASWAPWVLSFGLALFRGGHRQAIRSTPLLAFAIGMILLAGHLQIAAYGIGAFLVLVLAMAAFQLREKQAWTRAALAAGALAMGFGLAAPQLLPVLHFSKLSHRQNQPTEQGYEMYVASAIPVSEFLGRLANPFAFGIPTIATDTEELVTSYWPAISRMRQGGNFAESASTLGPVVIALLLMLGASAAYYWLRPRGPDEDEFTIDWPSHRPLLAVGMVGLIAFLLAVGSPLNALLYYGVPGWSASGSPGRAVYLFVLVGCAVAGLAVRDYPRMEPKTRGLIALGAFILTAATISVAMASAQAVPEGIKPEVWSVLTSVAAKWNQVLVFVVPLVGASTLLALRPQTFGLVVALAFLPTAALVATGIVRAGDPSFLVKPSQPNYGRHAYANDAWDPLTAAKAYMPPNTASAMRIHDAAGYDSLISKTSVEWLKEVLGQDPAPPANGNILFVKPSADTAKLAEAGVSSLDQVGQPTLGLLTKGRAYTPSGPARIVEEGYDRLIVQAQGPGKLVVTDTNLPGWTATVDGEPATIKAGRWRVVELPQGEHNVEFRYTPPGLSVGAGLGLAAMFAVLAISLAARRLKSLDESAVGPKTATKKP